MADPTPAPKEKSLVDKAKDAFNAAKDSWNSHEDALIGSIKGMMGLDPSKRHGFTTGDPARPVEDVVDEAVKGAPGNNADY